MSLSGAGLPAVVFTDLDGSLLDHNTYLPGPAAPALAALVEKGVLVVFCSAKTFAEQVHLQADLGLEAPVIVENGAAIVHPDGSRVVLGLAHTEAAERLAGAAAEAGVEIRGYDDMTLEEISALTGLTPEEAERARNREYTVTFLVIEGGDEGVARLEEAMGRSGLRLTRGSRFLSAQGPHDKGAAVRHLVATLSDGVTPPPPTFGIGDYLNDAEMLAAVDVPMLVRLPDGLWADLVLPGVIRLEGVGPHGWAQAAQRILETVGP